MRNAPASVPGAKSHRPVTATSPGSGVTRVTRYDRDEGDRDPVTEKPCRARDPGYTAKPSAAAANRQQATTVAV